MSSPMSQDTSKAHDKFSSGKESPKPTRTEGKCNLKPDFEGASLRNACPDPCIKQADALKQPAPPEKPDDVTDWYWNLKQTQYGSPPSPSSFRTAKYRWEEQQSQPCYACSKRKYINPYETKKRGPMSGGTKRQVVERWGKMWDSALSDLKFDRIVFENNPDAEETYRSEKDRIDDGCRKLWSIAKMNQNIITMMMKKFVSGPPNKLYTLNRIEAAQCWARIINDDGLVKEECCVTLPRGSKRKYNIPSLKTPKSLQKGPDVNRASFAFRLPKVELPTSAEQQAEYETKRSRFRNRSSAYWLDPELVPPVPAGFREEEFDIDSKNDPTGEIRRDLLKAKDIAKRYTRFAHIIERAIHVVPNLDRVNRVMDEHFVAADPAIRRQTLLHNFFSSQKMDTSPEFRRDALYATILSRNDNPKGTVVKKPFPYVLAEMSKSKSKNRTGS